MECHKLRKKLWLFSPLKEKIHGTELNSFQRLNVRSRESCYVWLTLCLRRYMPITLMNATINKKTKTNQWNVGKEFVNYVHTADNAMGHGAMTIIQIIPLTTFAVCEWMLPQIYIWNEYSPINWLFILRGKCSVSHLCQHCVMCCA